MCPNCILNQVGIQSGIWVAFFICGVFFVAALGAMWFAFKNGDFEDMEASKFDMLDDVEDGTEAAHARARFERARRERAEARLEMSGESGPGDDGHGSATATGSATGSGSGSDREEVESARR